jgi:hypothetical protein
METPRLQQVLDRIDQLNRADPHRVTVEGVAQPWEWCYAEWVTAWVMRLNPQAAAALRIAARGQHVRRWTIPRDRYERTRRGYLRWRETLKTFHAQTVAELMREAGYPAATIERVQQIMSKRQLGTDPETQTLEDALCLVFLEKQWAALREKTPPETMRDILKKTWRKMSEQGRAAALALPLAEADRRALLDALAEGAG